MPWMTAHDRKYEIRAVACSTVGGGMSDPLRKIIGPIVRGQLRSFIMAHPEAGLHKKWIASIEKRITNDLLSGDCTLRLRAALGCTRICGELRDGGLGTALEGTEPPAAGMESVTVSVAIPKRRGPAAELATRVFGKWIVSRQRILSGERG